MYEIFVKLCQERGVTPYQVSKATGISQAAFSTWKKGRTVPRESTLRKVADYFHVSVRYLRGEDHDPGAPSPAYDPELYEYLDMLRNRSECRMLFSLAKDATPEDVRRAVAVIEALRNADTREP